MGIYNKIKCNYQIQEHHFHYEKLPNIESSIKSNFLFNGYFQSHKYFQDHYNLIYSDTYSVVYSIENDDRTIIILICQIQLEKI